MSRSAITAIVDGEVYAPRPLGNLTLVIAAGKILALERSGLEFELIDAAGCVVAPGLIDPHEHLIGGSGEEGFATQTPEISLTELIRGGITTVVGCLGTDTVTRTMEALLAKARVLAEQGISAALVDWRLHHSACHADRRRDARHAACIRNYRRRRGRHQ